jgi:hypothetical protein
MIAYTLKQDDDGQWSIRCKGSILASGLPLVPAIKQAHQMAHTKRMETGSPTSVEVFGAAANGQVAEEGRPEPGLQSATA